MPTEINQKPKESKKQKGASERWSIERASKELSGWRKSGLSMAEYCRRRGLEAKQLYNWRARLENGTDRRKTKCSEGAALKKQSDVKQSKSQETVRLVEAEILCNAPKRATDNADGKHDGPLLTLALCRPERIEIEVHRHVEANWLMELVRGISEHHQ